MTSNLTSYAEAILRKIVCQARKAKLTHSFWGKIITPLHLIYNTHCLICYRLYSNNFVNQPYLTIAHGFNIVGATEY